MHSERAEACKTDHMASGEYIQAFTDPATPSKTLIGQRPGPGSIVVSFFAPAPIVSPSVIDLRDPEIGTVPLPVFSLSIRISILLHNNNDEMVRPPPTKV